MRRWLVLSLGLGLAALAAWALLTAGSDRGAADRRAPAPDERALEEIDPASQERLEKLLREEAEAEPGEPEPANEAAPTKGGRR